MSNVFEHRSVAWTKDLYQNLFTVRSETIVNILCWAVKIWNNIHLGNEVLHMASLKSKFHFDDFWSLAARRVVILKLTAPRVMAKIVKMAHFYFSVVWTTKMVIIRDQIFMNKVTYMAFDGSRLSRAFVMMTCSFYFVSYIFFAFRFIHI